MNLPKFALEHKPVIFGFALVLFFWGLSVFLDAPRREDPEFTVREALVITDWPGATAQQVEELITDKVEIAAANIKQVRRVQSWSTVGRSVVQVSGVDEAADIQEVWTKLRAEMNLLAPSLPEGSTPPAVDDNFGNTAALILAIYQDPDTLDTRRYSPSEMEAYAKKLRDNLMDLRPTEADADGKLVPITTEPAYVARLDIYGAQREVIYLEADAGVWSQLALTSTELQELLRQRNVVAPAGVFNTASDRIHTKISSDLDATREIGEVVVGRVAAGSESPERRTLSEFQRDLQAGEGDGGQPAAYEVPVHLQDLRINVKRGYADPPETLVRFGDNAVSSDAIVLSFTMKPGQNITWLGDEVDRLLATANSSFLPPDILIEKVSNPPFFVQSKIDDVVSNLVQAVGLVLLILGMLAGWRVAVVTAASIPLIMLSALALMRPFDIQIEQMSLAALIVALGLLVDNTIVTCENTTRALNEGKPRKQAVIDGCNQVGGSLLWSSLTTIGVFIPMAFVLPGDLGEYIFSLPVVVTLTLLISWLCAMTMTPILNYYILVPTDGRLPILALFDWVRRKLGMASKAGRNATEPAPAKGKSLFARISQIAIVGRIPTIFVAFSLLAAALMLPVKPSFFPFSDRSQFVVDVWLPETSPIFRTDTTAQRVEELVKRLNATTWQDGQWVPLTNDKGEPQNRLSNMVTYVGTGGPRFYVGLNPGPTAPHYATLLVNARNRDQVSTYIKDIRRAAWSGIGAPGEPAYVPPIVGARIVPKQLVMGTPVSSPIEYRLTGPRQANQKVLGHYGEKLKAVLHDSGLVWDVHDSWGAHGLQFDVDLNLDRANMAGVTNESVANTLNAYYSGAYLTDFREGDKQLPVMLRLPEDQRRELNDLRSAYVEGFAGKVPLNSVAEFNLSRVPTQITRYQRERVLRILARPEPGLLARDILAKVKPEIDAIAADLPSGYRIVDGGIEEEANRGERANSVALGVGILLVVFCLLLQYNSAVKPLLIILTVPLSIIGAMMGLWVRGVPLGFMETLGFLALFGTVLNAAILMIDFVEQLILEKLKSGEDLAPPGKRSYCGLTRDAFRACLVEAGEARMMPIFMTTATTVAGLMSLMFGGGPLFMGLATAFAAGLVVGSAITLLVLPALIALFVENFRYQMVDPKTVLSDADTLGEPVVSS
ncbi:efflux RND transporter permease subunit [Ruegeria sp. MALMAid1280]|uniref:efflux RND transporter permease subunit n=1 Tax=Ruegeria sp. MALMAid1280 TaxID=3411634 RepID=UPI003BA0D52F